MELLLLSLAAFTGFAFGRAGHMIGGQLGDRGINVKYWPHHWVFGALAILLGLFLIHKLGGLMIAFGVGHIISDLNDLLKGRVFDASQEPEIKKFWGID